MLTRLLAVAAIALSLTSAASAAPILTITDGPGGPGTFTVTYNNSNINEDDTFTVVNNSSSIIKQLNVTGPTLFSFDGDGPFDGGYNGPNETTTVINSGNALVNFTGPNSFGIPGLAPGQSGLFGVDNESGTGNNFTSAIVTQSTPTPEPATLAVFGLMGLAGAGYVRRRKAAPVA